MRKQGAAGLWVKKMLAASRLRLRARKDPDARGVAPDAGALGAAHPLSVSSGVPVGGAADSNPPQGWWLS